jgi:hypothetical protein
MDNPSLVTEPDVVLQEWRQMFSNPGRILPCFMVDPNRLGDYSDIQSAVDALFTTGGTIVLKPGTYTLSATITLPAKPIRFVGMAPITNLMLGQVPDALSTVKIVLPSSVTDAVFTIPSTVTTARSYIFENIRFTGGNVTGQYLLKCSAAQYMAKVVFKDCYVEDIEKLVRDNTTGMTVMFDGCGVAFPAGALATARHYSAQQNAFTRFLWVNSWSGYPAAGGYYFGGSENNQYLELVVSGPRAVIGSYASGATKGILRINDGASMHLYVLAWQAFGAVIADNCYLLPSAGTAGLSVSGADVRGAPKSSFFSNVNASAVMLSVNTGTPTIRITGSTFASYNIDPTVTRWIDGVGGESVSGTSVNTITNVVTQGTGNGAAALTGGVGIKNTHGANTLTYNLSLTDVFGNTYTSGDVDILPSGYAWIDLNVDLGGAHRPYQYISLGVKSKVAGAAATYKVFAAIAGGGMQQSLY